MSERALFEHVCTSLHAGLRRLVLVGNSDSWDEEPAATSGVPTGMVWLELGAGLSPLVAGCDHWTYLSTGLRRRRHGVRPNAGGRCTIYYATAMRVFANRSSFVPCLFKRGEEG